MGSIYKVIPDIQAQEIKSLPPGFLLSLVVIFCRFVYKVDFLVY